MIDDRLSIISCANPEQKKGVAMNGIGLCHTCAPMPEFGISVIELPVPKLAQLIRKALVIGCGPFISLVVPTCIFY